MSLHGSTFEFLKPTDQQIADMGVLRAAGASYARMLDSVLPDGPDKDHCLRLVRDAAMWANVCMTRWANGEPRESDNGTV